LKPEGRNLPPRTIVIQSDWNSRDMSSPATQAHIPGTVKAPKPKPIALPHSVYIAVVGGGTVKAPKPKPIARPKKPSKKEEALRAVEPPSAPKPAPEPNGDFKGLAIQLARNTIADDQTFEVMERLAFQYIRCLGN
jgi:cell division septation protein DedD